MCFLLFKKKEEEIVLVKNSTNDISHSNLPLAGKRQVSPCVQYIKKINTKSPLIGTVIHMVTPYVCFTCFNLGLSL